MAAHSSFMISSHYIINISKTYGPIWKFSQPLRLGERHLPGSNISRGDFFSELWTAIGQEKCRTKLVNRATLLIGCALESWDSQLSNAYPTIFVALLVLILIHVLRRPRAFGPTNFTIIATVFIGCALESWDSQLSNAHPKIFVALLVLILS